MTRDEIREDVFREIEQERIDRCEPPESPRHSLNLLGIFTIYPKAMGRPPQVLPESVKKAESRPNPLRNLIIASRKFKEERGEK